MNDKIQALYRVYEARLEGLEFQLGKLNKKAAKLGVQPIVLRRTGHFEDVPVSRAEKFGHDNVPHHLWNEVVEYRRFIQLELTGSAPRFAGWNLAAVIESSEEAGNIIRKSPGQDKLDLSAYRTGKSCCDHCKAVRNRRDTFIVVHDDGSLKRVGSDCIKDFLGHADPHALLKLAEIMFAASELCGEAEDYDEFAGGGWVRPRLNIDQYLAFCAVAVRKLGYISATRKREQEEVGNYINSTADTAKAWMNPFRGAKLNEDYFNPEEVDVQRAEAARQFVLDTIGSKAPEAISDFENNLLVACKSEVLEWKNAGIVAFVIAYHSRETEKKVLQSTQRYYGTPKQRARNVKIKYLKSTGFDSQFGHTFIHSFAGPEGERLVWKTGTELSYDAGQEIVATFTVKEHSTYRDNLQTLITRVVDETPAPFGAPAHPGSVVQGTIGLPVAA